MSENIQDKLDSIDSKLIELTDGLKDAVAEMEALSEVLSNIEDKVDEAITKIVLDKIKDDTSIKDLLRRIAKTLGL